MTVAEVAAGLGLSAVGDVDIVLRGVARPNEAGADDLALAMDPKFLPELKEGAARAAVTPADVDLAELGLAAAILAPRARYAMAGVTRLFQQERRISVGAHPSAVIDPSAQVDPSASIGPLVVVGPGARVCPDVVILGSALIGEDAVVGPGCLLHPGVRIGDRVRLGARCIIHQNAVVGSDGFSFVTPERGSVESAKAAGIVAEGAENRVWARIASLGAVELGDDVEIGSNTSIDRGTVTDTRIGHGVKIDNLVQIGHNVSIGENCLICGQVGIAGSAELGARVVLGGQAGVADHSKIGDDVVVMAASALSGVVKPRSVVGGVPAVPREEVVKMHMGLRRLPRALEDLAELKNRFSRNEPSG